MTEGEMPLCPTLTRESLWPPVWLHSFPLLSATVSFLFILHNRTVGTAAENGEQRREARFRTVSHTLAFVLGFSAVFYTLGFGAGVFGQFFIGQRELIRQLSAILIIVMGLFLLGIFQPRFLMRERKLELSRRPAGYIGSFIFGIGFGRLVALHRSDPDGDYRPVGERAGNLAETDHGLQHRVRTSFFLLAFFVGGARRLLKYSGPLMKIGGALMVFMGVLLFTDQMFRITIWLQGVTPSWLKF